MTHPTPLACSLTAAEGAQRAARWRRLLDARLLSRTRTTYGQRLAFPSAAAVARELDALIIAERQCCPFLTLTLERLDDALVLDVAAPPDAAPIVETMFEAAT
jgi:hypothetical protein